MLWLAFGWSSNLLAIWAFMLWITDKIVAPFEVSGFWTTVGAAAIIWIVNMLVHAIFRPERPRHPAPRSEST